MLIGMLEVYNTLHNVFPQNIFTKRKAKYINEIFGNILILMHIFKCISEVFISDGLDGPVIGIAVYVSLPQNK